MESMSECPKYFFKALVGFSMENTGLDDTEWEEKIIYRGLMDLLPLLGFFWLVCSQLLIFVGESKWSSFTVV